MHKMKVPKKVEKYRESPYLVIYSAMQEGIIIYDAKAIVAR